VFLCASINRSAAFPREKNKKADVVERPKAFHHVGLLFNQLPDAADFSTPPSRSLSSHPTPLNQPLTQAST
jgi:hypothetical protein